MNFECIANELIDEKLYFGTHKSGLKIYLLPKKFTKSYASFAVHYGSIDDRFRLHGEQNEICVPDGIAHFLEHKLFEKTNGGNAFDDYAKTGASANAYTNFNSTAYLFSCMNRLFENLEILLSFVEDPYFTAENVSKEQGIITQEIRMYEDNADWRVFFNLLEAMYHNLPVRKDIAGTTESIMEINKDWLYQCYHTFYNPSNMILFVAGDVADRAKIVALVDQYVATSDAKQPERIYPEEPKQVFENYHEQKLSVAAPIFMMGFKDADVGFDGRKLLKKEISTQMILEMILGKSSFLYRSLYDQGLVNESFSYEYSAEPSYAFTSFGGESPSPEKVKDIIMEELKKMQLQELDFFRARNILKGRFLHQFNNIENIGSLFVSSLFKGINPLDFISVCDEINFADITDRFEKHFKEEYMALSVIRPCKRRENGDD